MYGQSNLQDDRPRPLVKDRSVFRSNSVTRTIKANKRGYVALIYSGTARSFTVTFESHIVNLMAGCPFAVHLFFHTYMNDNRFPDSKINTSDANYFSLNATLAYFEGYVNLDNERVLFRDIVKVNELEYLSLSALRQIYNDTYDTLLARFPGHPPISDNYYIWHSQRRAEELRQKYMITTGIDYKWVFRVRLDAIFYTNWWQQAFDVEVYNSSQPLHENIRHDVASDWGIRPTRLYDMVYKPKLQENRTLYVPSGWSCGGYNDQFAAMSSAIAKEYFSRILHIEDMLGEVRLNSEISILLIAQWNNITVKRRGGAVCYDILRVPSNLTNINDQMNRVCQYKGSGKRSCKKLCPRAEEMNKALAGGFLRHTLSKKREIAITVEQSKSILLRYLSNLNNTTLPISPEFSSFYYFYQYIISNHVNVSCLPETWSTDQPNIYASQHLPFIIRTTNRQAIHLYNKHLSCGPLI